MNIVGIVVEYNPLHLGHAYHIAEAKKLTEAEGVIAVMSGNFLQRGEPAIVSKWARTEMALHAGVDLVLELPIAYAVQPAEWFSFGAAALLDATGIVSHLCFGSEAGTLAALLPLARRLAGEDEAFKAALASELASGASYPAAYASAAASTTAVGEGSGHLSPADAKALLTQPNNSLGLHYLIALQRLASPIVPVTIQRQGAGYLDAQPGATGIASATAIRRLLLSEGGIEAAAPFMPAYTVNILRRELMANRGPMTWEAFAQSLFHILLTHPASALRQYYEVTEGLEFRITKLMPRLMELSVTELLAALKTKRYTYTKLQRMLLHILLQHQTDTLSQDKLANGPHYIRVLGFTTKGRKLLKKMKHSSKLPIITRTAVDDYPFLELDIQAAKVYANAMPGRHPAELIREYQQPVMLP